MAAGSSETLVPTYQTTRRHISGVHRPDNDCHVDLKCQTLTSLYFVKYQPHRKKMEIAYLYIFTYKGLAWLIIMGSGFDDWVYWHSFTITVVYNSSHIEVLLNDICLTNLSPISDWSLLLEFTNALTFMNENLIEMTVSKGSMTMFPECVTSETMY
jgi:hypothetical protein